MPEPKHNCLPRRICRPRFQLKPNSLLRMLYGMNSSGLTPPLERKRKRRRRAIIVLLLLLSTMVVWQLVERLVRIDRYRPEIVKALSDATGMTVEVKRLDLDILPFPRVQALEPHLFDNDIDAYAESISANLGLKSLVRGKVNITELLIDSPQIRTKRDIHLLSSKWQAFQERRNAAPPSRKHPLAIKSLRVEDLTLLTPDTEAPWLTGDIDFFDVLASRVQCVFRGKMADYGPVRIRANAIINRVESPETPTVSARARVQGLRIDSIPHNIALPTCSFDGDFSVVLENLSKIYFQLNGQTVSPHKALEGPLTAKIWWQDNEVIVNDLDWRTDALRIRADLTTKPEMPLAAHIYEARAGVTLLNLAYRFAPAQPILISPHSAAEFVAHDLLVGYSTKGGLRLVNGRGSIGQFDIALPDGKTLARNVESSFTLKNDTVNIVHLKAEGVDLQGAAKPDIARKTTQIALTGSVDLADLPREAGPASNLHQLSGTVRIDECQATWAMTGAMPTDFSCKAVWQDGTITLGSTTPWARYTDITAHVAAGPESADITASTMLNGEHLVEANGQWHYANQTYSGRVSGVLSDVIAPLLPTESWGRFVRPAVESMGLVDFVVDGRVTDAGASVRVRDTSPVALTVGAQFLRNSSGMRLDTLNLTATPDLAVLHDELPAGLAAIGPLPIVFDYATSPGTLTLAADLTDADLTYHDTIIQKPAKMTSRAQLSASRHDGVWKPDVMNVDAAGEKTKWQYQDGKWVTNLNVNLAPLGSALPDLHALEGIVTAHVQTTPLAISANLADVYLALAPSGEATDEALDTPQGATQIGTISGDIAYTLGAWNLKGIHLHSDTSDVVLNLESANGAWKGDITGTALDIDSLSKAYHDLRTRLHKLQKSAPSSDTSANINVAVDNVYFHGGHFQQARATVVVDGATTRIRDLYAQPRTGRLVGEIELAPEYVTADGSFDGIDIGVIDPVLFGPNPRGLAGTVRGDVQFRAPRSDGAIQMAGLTGKGTVYGENGSLGKMGIATRLTTVLSATEVFRLRMPSMQDRGLLYDTCAATYSVENGVVFVETFDLRNPSLTLRAQGWVDLAKEDMNLVIEANLLEGVTGLMEKVPLIGGAVESVKKRTNLTMVAQGKPTAPSIRVEPTKSFETLVEGVKKVSGAGEEAVVRGVADTIDFLSGQ